MSLSPTYEFRGIANYQYVLGGRDTLFLAGFRFLSILMFTQVPIMTVLAIALAIILNSALVKAKVIFRTAIVLPMMTSIVVSAITWDYMFGERFGLINNFLRMAGLPGQPWLLTSFFARASIIMVMLWRWTGYNMILFLAGLQAIPEELYDAAKLDAGRLQAVWYITLPLLKPMIIFATIMNIVGCLQCFAEPYILTRGGPGNATYSVLMRIYNMAFGQYQFGYAAAGSWVLALVAICASVLFMWGTGFFKKG